MFTTDSIGLYKNKVNREKMYRAYMLQSTACVLLLRHHVAPEKAEQRRGEKKGGVALRQHISCKFMQNTESTPASASVAAAVLQSNKESRERRHCWLQRPLSRPEGSVCTRQEEAERAGPGRPGTNREPAHPPTSRPLPLAARREEACSWMLGGLASRGVGWNTEASQLTAALWLFLRR